MLKKNACILSILAILLSISFLPVQASGPWIGSKELVYSNVLSINIGSFYSENQTIYWSFTSTSDSVNISIYKFVNYSEGGGYSIPVASGIAEGKGSFVVEKYLNYSVRFAHVDWDHREENATVTAVITDITPSTESTIQTHTANLATGIIFSTLMFISYTRNRKRRNGNKTS
jgi:hypothetical protein